MELPELGSLKLVIWDMDDTFWGGTLAEGGAVYNRNHHDLVIAMARRGVISSICSNNEERSVRDRLEAEGLWDYFVFPSVAWGRKGTAVARIIEEAQLRAENVVFVDDRQSNLDEARLATPGLVTMLPAELPRLSEIVLRAPESDPEMSRLARYRVLQQKKNERAQAIAYGVREEEFLRRCEIVVQEIANPEGYLKRITELVERTNQLNFTALRSTRDELDRLIRDPLYRCGAVRVADRYGDYGIVGFWAVHRDTCTLVHFLFSCRVLNMGIEAWAYHHLGRPRIQTTKDVSEIASVKPPTWITVKPVENGAAPEEPKSCAPHKPSAEESRRVFAKGGCMLVNFIEVWEDQDPALNVTMELGHWASHTSSIPMRESPRYEDWLALAKCWTHNHDYFDSQLFAGSPDTILLELSKDIRCGLYETKDGLIIPFAPVGFDLTAANAPRLLEQWLEAPAIAPGPWRADDIYTDEGLEWLRTNCTYVSDERRRAILAENLVFILNRIANTHPRAHTVLVVSATSQPRSMFPAWEHVANEAAIMAKTASRVAAQFSQVQTLCIQDFMESVDDFTTSSPFIVSNATCARIVRHLRSTTASPLMKQKTQAARAWMT